MKKLKLKTEKAKFFEAIQRAVVYEEADSNGVCTCISCGKRGAISEFDGGHGFSKGSSLKLARMRQNIHAQCRYCNRMLGGNQLHWFEGVKERYGLEEYELLMTMERASNGNEEALQELPEDVAFQLQKKWTPSDYREARLVYEKVIAENKYKERK